MTRRRWRVAPPARKECWSGCPRAQRSRRSGRSCPSSANGDACSASITTRASAICRCRTSFPSKLKAPLTSLLCRPVNSAEVITRLYRARGASGPAGEPMRRTLFGKSPELERLAPTRASARDALLFDVRDHGSTTNLALAERRVDGWTFAPWLLLAGHLIIGVTLLFEKRPPATQAVLASVFVPLALSLLTDVAAGLVFLTWRRMQMAPHTVARIMCGYIGATGVLWTMSSVAAERLQLADQGFVTLAMASGFFVRSMAAIVSPPLAVVNALVAIGATVFFSRNLEITL